ncbi:hypothetical protein [Micromonospora radicis]|uniref:Uncharacterized protein n=1 Tax=Micromonospora radicis TaxID=1894971 RepID=A0A418MRF0_9ACTN|nr:hypothetical protein [Micromonospora radicis]RIV36399.1 hypothetical protein D2L64_19735 [Micromonospora radicis]
MSTEEFSGVDHDLLADYLGGALVGTPEQAEVARRVADDPDWARAHAQLAPALADVRADLFAWGGGSTPEMPAEVTDRILAALDAADPAGSTTELPAEELAGSGQTGDLAPDDAKSSLVPVQPLGGPRRPGGAPRPGQDRDTPTRPGRRRRRWARVAAPVALATAAVVGLGALQLSGPNRSGDDSASTALSETNPVAPYHDGPRDTAEQAAGASPERGPVTASAPFQLATPPRHTGTDYTTEALRVEPAPTSKLSPGTAEPEISAQGGRLAGPGDLERLGDQLALSACLAEIDAEHGNAPLVFDGVEYARFQGLPALVVRFTDGTGGQWAWVSGPECGVPGSGSDTRYRTRVG